MPVRSGFVDGSFRVRFGVISFCFVVDAGFVSMLPFLVPGATVYPETVAADGESLIRRMKVTQCVAKSGEG